MQWYPAAEYPPPPPIPTGDPRKRRSRGLLVGGLLVLVLALIAGVGVIVMQYRDADGPRPERMLAQTFPTSPGAAWTVDAASLAGGVQPMIATPIFQAAFYGNPGVVVADGVAIVQAVQYQTDAPQKLVGIDLENGNVLWSVTAEYRFGCARTTIDGRLPCIEYGGNRQQTELRLIDVRSGSSESTYRSDGYLNAVATDGDSLYTAASTEAGLTVTKGTSDNPFGDWATTVAPGLCAGYGGGDGLDLRIDDGIVYGYVAGGASALLRVSDGSAVTDHDVMGVSVPQPGTILATRCKAGGPGTDPSTEVIDPDGSVRFSTGEGVLRPVPNIPADPARPIVVRSGAAYDSTTGEALWTAPGWGTGDDRPWQITNVGGVMLSRTDGQTQAHAIASGKLLWRAQIAGDLAESVTDGDRLIVPDDGSVSAYSMLDGTIEWSVPVADYDRAVALTATDLGIVYVSNDGVGLISPTGGRAVVPSPTYTWENGSTATDAADAPRVVTKCGSTPRFEPVAVRTESDALTITMKIVATCPGGDVMSSSDTRIAVTSNDQNVAAGSFDLSATPIVVPPPGEGSVQNSAEREFRFPKGSFWRVPISSTANPGSAGQSDPNSVDLQPDTLVIACEQAGRSSTQSATFDPATEKTASAMTAVAPAAPATGDPESASFDALRAIANSDRPFVTGQLADRWVPQISSKRPGLVADGITWNNAETLREHLDLRLLYPEVRLLWSGDWSTFSVSDFWVTIAGVTFPDPSGALGWCASRGLDREHCYAKLVSATHGVEGSTEYQN